MKISVPAAVILAVVWAGPLGVTAHEAVAAEARVISLKVTQKGFEPATVKVKKGEPLKLKVTRTTQRTCATELLIEGSSINVPLPLNQEVEIAYTPTKTGQIKYGCAMNKMISGILDVE